MLAVYQIDQIKYLLLKKSHPLHIQASRSIFANDKAHLWINEQTKKSDLQPWIALADDHIIRFELDNQHPHLYAIEHTLDQRYQKENTHSYLNYHQVIVDQYTYLYPGHIHFLSTALLITFVAMSPILHHYLGAQFLSLFMASILTICVLRLCARPLPIIIENQNITPENLDQLLGTKTAALTHYNPVIEPSLEQNLLPDVPANQL